MCTSRLAAFIAISLLAMNAGRLMAEEIEFDKIETFISAGPNAPTPPNRGVFREYAVRCLLARDAARGMNLLATYITQEMAKQQTGRLSRNRLKALAGASDAFLLLTQIGGKRGGEGLPDDVIRWLLGSNARMDLLLENLDRKDDWPACATIIETLYKHDPGGRDTYLNLILALAMVWDQPRTPPHRQMGNQCLKYDTDILARYDYFKDLYSSSGSRSAKVPYSVLSVSSLMFVVDTPVPVSELEWVRNNVRGTVGRWDDKFSDITYDEGRFERQAYVWTNGPYTLQAISELGGICVDQAYFATMTARAFGIPAMIFTGPGRRGPHAWFGYLKSKDDWEVDCGRYAYDKYATGQARDPQTNELLTDHQLQFSCQRSLRSSAFQMANRYGRLATVLLMLQDEQNAVRFAGRACETLPLYAPGWGIRQKILQVRKDWDGLIDLLDQQAAAYKRFPDAVANIRCAQADVLRKLGRDREADAVLRKAQRRVDGTRDDLAQGLGIQRVEQAVADGDPNEAREKLEDLLKDNEKEGSKVLPLIEGYLKLTKETKQTKEGARFLKSYIRTMLRTYGSIPQNKRIFLNFLLRAYENDGDTRNAARVRKDLDRTR